jgi:uncharacterized membrane protein YozB (DUF420 family)
MFEYSDLPSLNAFFNSVSFLLLLGGFWAIRGKRIPVHRAFMLTAVGTSILFLISYVIYHVEVGSVAFRGHGVYRPLYFTILITHIILAISLVPLVIITVLRALRGQIDRHRRIARWTLPIWLYVSITGVVIYGMVFVWYPQP